MLDDRRLAGLSLTACSYALMLVAMSDHEGRIYTGGKPLVAFVAGRRGATRGDRRLMEREFAELSRVGFLSDRGDHVQVIAHAPRAARESSTTAQRPRNEAPTNEQRSSNDSATKTDLTHRNHEDSKTPSPTPSPSENQKSEGEGAHAPTRETPDAEPAKPIAIDRTIGHLLRLDGDGRAAWRRA